MSEDLTEEWGVWWPWSQTPEPSTSKESAQWRAKNAHGGYGVVMRRLVSRWQEPEED